jgi:leader peptidase (prepilin peptidase) / N-methyltransferase
VEVALAAVGFAPGLVIGSFLNVVAARVPLRRSIVHPRSACMACGTEIAWQDNVPVISWLRLHGKCRHCSAAIPARYPLVELVTGLLVAACFVAFGLTAYAVLAAAFCAVLVVISAIDLEHRIVPNRIVVPATGIVLVAHTLIDPSPEWLIGGLCAFAFLLLTAIVYPAGMGMGDVKLAAFLGVMLGREVAVALMAGMVLALVPSVVLLARHGSGARKMGIPFAPFLAGGALVALFFGERLLDAYLSFL